MIVLLLINITGPDKPGLTSKRTSIFAGDIVPVHGNPVYRYALADLIVTHPENQVAPIS